MNRNDIYEKKYLKGIFSVIYDSTLYKVYIKFLFIKIAQVTFSYGNAFLKICGMQILKSKKLAMYLLLPVFNEFVKSKVNKDVIDIIACFNRSGETFLCAHHLNEYFINNGIKNPVFASTSKYIGDLYKLFYPDIQFVKVPQLFFELHFLNLHKHNIISNDIKYYELLTRSHFLELEAKAQGDDYVNFYSELKNRIGVSDLSMVYPVVTEESKKSAQEKMQSINLSSKFVFISPDAQSNGSLTSEFWEKLALILYKNGYDVLFNTIPGNIKNTFFKTKYFTLDEVRYVTENASTVIAVRSGLLDVIASSCKSVHCVYMPFLNRGVDLPPLAAEKVQNTFSLKYLPSVDKQKIYEYNAEEIGSELILEMILKELKLAETNISSNKAGVV